MTPWTGSWSASRQVDELALGPATFDATVDERRNARRIIAAIFELAQPIEEPGRHHLLRDDTDNSAHRVCFPTNQMPNRDPAYYAPSLSQSACGVLIPGATPSGPLEGASVAVVGDDEGLDLIAHLSR
jgi:hypothetical protein